MFGNLAFSGAALQSLTHRGKFGRRGPDQREPFWCRYKPELSRSEGAHLSGANLASAILKGANLFGATLTGATMPDGSKHA